MLPTGASRSHPHRLCRSPLVADAGLIHAGRSVADSAAGADAGTGVGLNAGIRRRPCTLIPCSRAAPDVPDERSPLSVVPGRSPASEGRAVPDSPAGRADAAEAALVPSGQGLCKVSIGLWQRKDERRDAGLCR